MRLNEITSEKK